MRKILKRAFCILLAVVLAVPGFGLESFAAEAGMDSAFAKTDGMSLTGSSSLGNLLTEKLEEEAEKQLENNGYNVFDTKIEDNVAVVSYEAKGDCTLIVAIYDETETQMYASGSIDVSSEETETQVQLETVNMPEYFIIKAYLVDTENMNPMCTVYENNMYTKEMQEFLEKTTEDFEEEKVVNLDSDITTNYLVCSEETKLIEGKEGVNEVTRADDESSTYTIENADKSVTSLKEGDIFVYPYEEDRILVVKISSMEVNGTTAVISGAETSLEEAFDYVRIEGSADTKDVEIDDSTCEEGVAYKGIGQDSADEDNDVTDMDRGSGKEEYTATFEFLDKKLAGKEWDNGEAKINLSGKAAISLSMEIEVYITLKEQHIKLQFDYGVNLKIALTGEVSAEIPLAVFGFSPVPGVLVELTPSIVFDFSAKLEFSGEYSGTIGFQAGNKGITNLTTAPKTSTKLEAEGTFFVGVSLKPKMKILHDKIAKAELEGKAGVEFGVVPDETTKDGILSELKKTNTKIHMCENCLDGTVTAKVEIGFSVSFLGLEKLTFGMEKTFSREIGKFYLSMDTWTLGTGSCPNKIYKVMCIVRDEYGKPIANASVNDKELTDKNGIAVLWLTGGEHTIEAEKENFKTRKRTVTIESARKIPICLSEGDEAETLINTVKAASSNLSTAVIAKDGSLYMWGYNSEGQIGDGTKVNRSVPVKVLDNVKSAECNSGTTIAVTNSGELYVWGKYTDSYVPKKMLDNVKIAKTGSDNGTFLAITNSGELYMWGYNGYGRIGNGNSYYCAEPYKVLDNVKEADCSLYTTTALTKDGTLYVWGRNHYGQVGNGTHEDCYTPTAVLTNVKSAKFSTAGTTLAITNDESLYMWGYNGYGQLGKGDCIERDEPCKIMENVKAAECSEYGTTLAVTKDGNLYMWGYKYSEEPVKFLENVKSAELPDAQDQVVAAITEDGSLYMWGDNTWGQIGNGSTIDVTMSTYKVLENVKSVKCTYWGTTLAITNDDELYMWGYNGRGQVGNGSRSSAVTEPEKILVNVKSAVCEGEVSYAVTKSGKLYMWGWNYWNQIEYGKGVYVTEPYRKIFMGKTSVSAVTTDDVTDVTLETESSTEILARNFTDLNPGEIYNVYVMKNSEAENKFASENLYYVNQYVADKNGNLSVSCKIPVAESEAEFVVAGIAELENTPGDVNSDGKINALDALRVLKSVADMIKLTLEEECAADVNADEKADALDALLILKYTAGMIRNFG